jgi:hypothetical protein
MEKPMIEIGCPEQGDALAVMVKVVPTVLPLYGLVTLIAARAGKEDRKSRDAARESKQRSFIFRYLRETGCFMGLLFGNVFRVFNMRMLPGAGTQAQIPACSRMQVVRPETV